MVVAYRIPATSPPQGYLFFRWLPLPFVCHLSSTIGFHAVLIIIILLPFIVRHILSPKWLILCHSTILYGKCTLYYGFFFVRPFKIPSLPPHLDHSVIVTLTPPSESGDSICIPNATAFALSSGVSNREIICSPSANKSLYRFGNNPINHRINPLLPLICVGRTV